MTRRRGLVLVWVLMVALAALAPIGASANSADDTPGTAPTATAPELASTLALPSILATTPVAASPIAPVVSESGLISLSVDAVGSNSSNPADVIVSADKPDGATVRSAFLAAASTGFSEYVPETGDILIDGQTVVFDESMTMVNGIFSVNVWADVTDLVKPKLDAAPAGLVDFEIDETTVTFDIDGSILAVIYDDPNVELETTIVLAYGAQQVTGDRITLQRPPTVPSESVEVRLGVGISYGFQPAGQYSTIEVNGTLITSSAGGQDDGANSNGALITVGGLGDDPANPADPTATDDQASCPFCDDELYDLSEFVDDAAASSLLLTTENPSADDNVFFIALEVVGADATWIPSTGLRYNDVQQKGSHNSYTRREGLMDQLIYHRIRSIELDIQSTENAGEWWVSHKKKGGSTDCYFLEDCLDILRTFHEEFPDHEVITVFVDAKKEWTSNHSPTMLDEILTGDRFVGADKILTPGELFAACGDALNLVDTVTLVQDGVQVCDWPTLQSLRGKFMFVVTGDDQIDGYLAAGTVGFVAPGVDSYDPATAPTNVLFFNHKDFGQNKDGKENNPDYQLSMAVAEAGLISRFYNLENQDEFDRAVEGLVHHLTNDMVNYEKDEWSRTHNDFGWPFSVIDKETHPGSESFVEAGRILSVDVSADKDLWDKAPDKFHFGYVESTATAGEEWTALVSTVGSHAPKKTSKGCLMARAALTDDAAYFAVCRLADKNELQVQWRTADGDRDYVEAKIAPKNTLDEEHLGYIRLRFALDEDGNTCVYGDGGLSPSGHPDSPINGFKEIGHWCYEGSLPYRGIASTSETDKQEATFLYVNLKQNGVAMTAGGLTEFLFDVESSSMFDGLDTSTD